MNLIVPIAGRSTRFLGFRPKWMLTHPKGKFMAIEAISGFDLDVFKKIYFVYLKEHEEQYKFKKGFMEELEELKLLNKTILIELEKPTQDQPETVYQAIKKENITGPIFIKDSDNKFSCDIQSGNFVCYFDLNDANLIKPKNKSYIRTDDFNRILNIIEKRVISSYFCVGGYGFESAELFVRTLEKLNMEHERYISNVIYQCILEKQVFEAIPATDYNDWGTLQDWETYKKSFATLFIDLDGVLIQHSSCHFPPYYGESGELKENTQIIKKLRKSGKFQIIITTARPEKYRQVTENQLKRFGIEYDFLLMGQYHAKRIIINDYSKSNPYKSCEAINLKRNSEDLNEILRESIGIDYEEI
ncbi:MAG: hypothetical protein HQ543_06785 [Bacteroidetes bacterium]|nr:hypothetical protein [Bacteroidota bacterium]